MWFLKGQTSDKTRQYRRHIEELRVDLFIVDNRKWTTCYLKNDRGKLWMKWLFFPFLDAVATIDVPTASNNDVNLVETRTEHFAWPLNRRFVLRE